ncbi:hypothetical protein AOLI_G00212520 [Acnodon oligacanthus]
MSPVTFPSVSGHAGSGTYLAHRRKPNPSDVTPALAPPTPAPGLFQSVEQLCLRRDSCENTEEHERSTEEPLETLYRFGGLKKSQSTLITLL